MELELLGMSLVEKEYKKNTSRNGQYFVFSPTRTIKQFSKRVFIYKSAVEVKIFRIK